MHIIRRLVRTFSHRERVAALVALGVFLVASVAKASLVIDEKSIVVAAPGGTYTEGMIGQPTALNPVIAANSVDESLVALVYGTLGDFTEDVSVKDGRVYTVKLKEGLTWEDGMPLTSDDLIFTVSMIQSPETQSPRYQSFEGVIAERVSELRVTFTLPSPYVFFGDTLRDLRLVPRHIFGHLPPANLRLSAYNLEPLASGPYRVEGFVKRRDGFITEYRLVRNDAYEGTAPFIKKFVIRFYENEKELTDAYRRRAIDGFGAFSLPETERPLRGAVDDVDTASYYAVFLNPRAKTVLGNEAFREALRQAVDKDELVKTVFQSGAVPVDGPDPYDAGTEAADPERASSTIRALAETEGPLQIELAYPDVGFLARTAAFVKGAWERAGVSTVRLVPLDEETFMNRVVRERNYEAVLFGNVLEHPYDLFPFWHSSERFYPGLNLALFSDKRVDTLLEDIRQETDEVERKKMFEEAVADIVADSPAVFLYTVPYAYVHDERLGGFGPEKRLTTPADRFDNVAAWYVRKVRVLETDGDVAERQTR